VNAQTMTETLAGGKLQLEKQETPHAPPRGHDVLMKRRVFPTPEPGFNQRIAVQQPDTQ
jgi:hypothetical protein